MFPWRGNSATDGRRSGWLAMGALAVAALSLLLPATALGSTADVIAPQHPPDYTPGDGWQAGTCKEEPPESAQVCSVATPGQFFERAAAHPSWGFTQFIVKHTTVGLLGAELLETPVGELETVRVDLPVGLSVNPGAAPRCPIATFEAGAANCPAASQVGESAVTASLAGVPAPPLAPLTRVPVYNLVPKPGEPARFGLELAGNEVFLEASLDWSGDYHEGFTIAIPRVADLEPLVKGLILKNRLVFDGRAGDGTFITTPSTCLGEATPGPAGTAYSTWLLAGSWSEEAEPGYSFPASAEPRFQSPIPPGTSPKECDTIPYAPSLEVAPGTTAADSPAGAAVAISVPHILGAGTQDSSDTRTATVALPAGMGINPAAANGLAVCTDAELGKGTRNPVACPPASKIGTVRIESPPLPEGALEGDVFVGQQLSRDPASGNEFRIFVDAESPRYGVSVRLVGHVRADPRTGQLTTTFAEDPQVPFSSFRLQFDGGARATLSSPPTCGPNVAAATMTPWSGSPPARPSSGFTLTTDPGGGSCAATMAARPFTPGFAAAPRSAAAGAFSPLSLHLGRAEGQQELKGAEILLAPGMTGRLAGIPYCPDAALAAAAAASGTAEAASSSCPAASLLGSATVAAGTGPQPLRIAGKVFLSGPYHGAPLSLAVVTPATAGPFDLGTVVVRVALFVDPLTAQVRAVADPLPDVFGGVKLDLRSVDLSLDRERFTLNPTSCEPAAITGSIAGGGADPANPAAFSSVAVSYPFQTTGCGALGFRPRLKTWLTGGGKRTRRGGTPSLHAVLTAREGDANIRRAALTLPHSEFLDQAHIGTVCTRPELAEDACPASSVYGYARAQTPLLEKELAGPVYLVPGGHALPDLVADLHGQVDIQLHAVISAAKARIRSVFYPVPDVPVSRFEMTMFGGKRGLLENSRDLCAGPAHSFLAMSAQNGKRRRVKRLPLSVPACHAHGRRHKRHRHHEHHRHV